MKEGYGIFCIASQLLLNSKELDICWEKATLLYEVFVVSKFNNPEESELDCINNFLTHIKK